MGTSNDTTNETTEIVDINILPEVDTVPDGKKMMFIDSEDNSGGTIPFEKMRKQIADNATDPVARAQIANIAKLPAGSTTGDAELSDIRVGADGKTYETAGDAVREQIKNAKQAAEDATASLKEDLYDLASKKMQYISSDTAQSDTLWRNLSNGLTRANGFSGFTTFSAFTVSKGKYYIDKPIWHKYSWVKKTNGTIVALNTIDGESGDNYSGVIEFTEDVELYITIKTANLPLMIVDGETAPSEYHDKGVFGKSVNGDYKVDNYTLSEIEESAIKDFSSIDYFFCKNGKLVCNNDKRTTSNAVAKYTRVDMGTNVKKAMCKFNSRGGGNVTLIASPLDTDNHVQNIVNKSIHCIFGMSSCVAQVFLNGTATSLGTITYPTLTADDETEYECGFEILNDATLRLYAPNGQTLDCTGNWSEYIGKYFIFEEYNGNPPSTDSVTALWERPSILSVYCKPTSGHCLRDDFVNYADGYIPLVAPSGHSYTNFRNANSNDGKYVNANGTHDN